MSPWIVIIGVSVITFVLRASFILFANPQKFPHGFRRALLFVPPAVLAAIVAPGLAMPAGTLDFTFGNPRWIAGLLAIAATTRFRHPLVPVVVGLPALWLLQWALG